MALDQERVTAVLVMSLIGWLALGMIVGGLYFTAMWWSAELFAAGRHASLALALTAGRLALITALLAMAAIRGGALPLLATALGIVVARFVAVRRIKVLAP